MQLSLIERAGFAIVVVTGAWAAWNGAAYAADPVLYHRAETAWLLFAIALIAHYLLRRKSDQITQPPEMPASTIWLLLFVAASWTLYGRTLGNGLLSDDFVLLNRVRNNLLIDPEWSYVRPLPLTAWWLIDRLVPTHLEPFALHLLSASMHGLNAWLVSVLAQRLGLSRVSAVLSGALFLAWPFHPETVAWPSDTFDLTTTAFILSAAVIVVGDRLSSAMRIPIIVLLTAAAFLSKESGVTTPLLMALLLPFVPPNRRRMAIKCVIASAAVVLAVLIVRLMTGTIPYELYPAGVIKNKLLTRPFGTMGFAFHADVLRALPWLGPAVAVSWVVLFVRAAWQRDARVFRFLAVAVGWVLVSVLPLWTMFYVDEFLSGSRFVYLASSMWSIAVMAMVAGAGQSASPLSMMVGIVIVAGSSALTVAHQQPWLRAAAVRDRVIDEWAKVPQHCDPRRAERLPDSVDGAYIFRNGFAEAVASPKRQYSTTCYVTWTGEAFRIND